jgi:AcrR family transcriptional regulator
VYDVHKVNTLDTVARRPPTRPVVSIWALPPPPSRPRDLQREGIVRAAIAVADRGGVDALTMAAVAHELGPYTPMALYRYVLSKEGLVDLMLDEVVGEVVVPSAPGPDWRADLWTSASSTWDMAMRHPWYAALVHSRPPLGPNALHRTERMLAILTARGATVAEAMTYAATIDVHVVGSALQAAAEVALQKRHGLTDPDDVAAAITALKDVVAPGSYPILAAWMAAPVPLSPRDQFELGLTFLLDGIAERLSG